MRDLGVLIRHDEHYERVEPRDDGVILHLQSGKQLKTDILLFANGRSGNSQDMGLEEIGIPPNQRGQLDINENFQTGIPHIYMPSETLSVSPRSPARLMYKDDLPRATSSMASPIAR